MTRTLDSVVQACLVMGVIVLSPYAMFATRDCGTGAGEDAPLAGTPAPQVEIVEPAPDTGPAGAQPVPGFPDGLDCRLPEVDVPRTPGCSEGAGYPDCKWQIPAPPAEDASYEIWRYTTRDHRWGRPALVALVLATAEQYKALHPGERLAVGDLDAPGDRHRTHAAGVDVDLYLPGRMWTENMGKGRYVDNYAGRSASFVDKCRSHVLDLARILASCSRGNLRIYYNDDPTREAFLEWFDARSLASPLGVPMQPHNELHRFHFHVTVSEDLPLLD
jgi:hypothetical protein